MWEEKCCIKSSRSWMKQLFTKMCNLMHVNWKSNHLCQHVPRVLIIYVNNKVRGELYNNEMKNKTKQKYHTLRIIPMSFRFRFMVLSATFNNILVMSWRSIVLVTETEVHRENHRPGASHWQTLSHNVVSDTPRHEPGSNSQP